MNNVKEIFLKYKLYFIIGIIGIILVFYFLNNTKKEEDVIEDINLPLEEEIIEEEEVEEEKVKFKIDIKGEVVNPGVYEVEDGMIINDAINLAGGLKETADTMDINLSQKLVSEMVIVISAKNDKITPRESKVSVGSITSSKESNSSGKVSLNNATLEELMTLNGIGEAKAKSIIEYRSKTPFTTIEELTNVKGIGAATFEKNKDRLTL